MKHARDDYNVIQDTAMDPEKALEALLTASSLAALVLDMGLATEKGLFAKQLARKFLDCVDHGLVNNLRLIETNGTTRIIPADEPVFLLRGQDKTAAQVVRVWADLAKDSGAAQDIIDAATRQADLMDAWPKKKVPDMKEQL